MRKLIKIWFAIDQFQRTPLQWRHNDHDGVSNHQPRGCLLNRLFRCGSKKTSKLPVTGLCAGNSPGPVNSPHKGPVTRKMFPFDDVIMNEARKDECNNVTGRIHGLTFYDDILEIHLLWHTLYTSSFSHYSDVMMSATESQLTGVSIVYSTVCSVAVQRKHQGSAPLVFERGFHRWPVVSTHKGLVGLPNTGNDAIMGYPVNNWC